MRGIHKFARSILRRAPAVSTDAIADEATRLLMGEVLSREVRRLPAHSSIASAEFQVFSQFGEDGILQFLIQHVGITPAEQRFVEFGVQDYAESNTRFLLLKDYWRGLVIDGSQANICRIREQEYYWRRDLTAVHAWITRDNINDLIAGSGIEGEIGVLSIDIDGNDYWVWDRVDVVQPVIVVVEWNALYGAHAEVTQPYDASFNRSNAHSSNLYWGASISALHSLGVSKGYVLVGSNRAGNNVFFVRRDRAHGLRQVSPFAAYTEPCFRESRDSNGKLTYLRLRAAQELIGAMPLVDLRTQRTTTVAAASAIGGLEHDGQDRANP